jgi:fibronectin type III domain protein
MGLTLQLRLFQTNTRNARRSRALETLIFGLAILTFSMLTGCSSSGDPANISIAPSSDGGGSSGGSNGSGSGGGGGSQTAVAGTASASLAWDSVSDSSVVGYIVHYGTQSPNSFGSCAYQQSTFSSSPSTTVAGLAANTTYYFAVSAYNGLESACSGEVTTVTGSA